MSRSLTITLASLAVLAPRAASSQSIEASATTFAVQDHVWFAKTRAEQTGQWVAGEGAISFRMLRVGMNAAFGSLSGGDALHPDRKGRATALTLHMVVKPWVAVGGVAEAKRFDSDLGPTVWRLLGANVRLTPSLDSKSLEGLVDVSYWPMATVIGGQKMSLAFRAVVGATYRVADGPVRVRLAYRFERFDFDTQGGGDRLEQFRGATIGALLAIGH